MALITKDLPDCKLVEIIREALPFLNMENGPWIAGGAVRRIYEGNGLRFSDIDVFFPNEDMQLWAVKLFNSRMSTKQGWSSVQVVDRVLGPMSATFYILYEDQKVPIQFISKKYFPSMEAILNDFDFTLCMWGTDGQKMVYDERAPRDLASKSLVLHDHPKRPKPNRLAKYVAQGFVPGPGVLSHMLGMHIKADWYKPENGLTYDYPDNY